MIEMSREEFEEAVADGLDLVPTELTDLMDNVVVLVEDEPPPEAGEPNLLGLYEGVPLTERGDTYFGVLPDVIHIYQRNICAISETPEQVVEEVRVTVVHEIAHHFGIDDDRLTDLGWG